MTSIRNANEVIQNIAGMMSIQLNYISSNELIRNMADQFRGRNFLLILDNFEHVIDAAEDLLDLLNQTDHLRIIITSQISLHASGEQIIRLKPLKLPEREEADVCQTSPAIMLFADRIRLRNPDFKITSENCLFMSRICRALDGLPLAIELTVSLLNLYHLEDLADEINHLLFENTGRQNGRSQRHSSIQAAIAWSYGLLTDREKDMFIRLSVFTNGFSREAAEAVCGETAGNTSIKILASLLDKSLIQNLSGTGYKHYRMLSPFYEFSRMRRVGDPSYKTLPEKHGCYYLELVEKLTVKLRGPHHTKVFQELQESHSNILLALEYFYEQDGIEAGLRMIDSLSWFWFLLGFFQPAMRWYRRFLAKSASSSLLLRIKGAHKLGWFLFCLGEWREARESYLHGKFMNQNLKDISSEIMLLSDLGVVERWLGNVENGILYGEQAVRLAREQGSPQELVHASIWAYATTGGSFDGAYPESELKTAAEIARDQQDEWNLAHAQAGLGDLYHMDSRYELANAYYEKALERFIRLNDRFLTAWTLIGIANNNAAIGNIPEALERLWEGLKLFDGLGDDLNTAFTLARFVDFSGRTDNQENFGSRVRLAASAYAILSGEKYRYRSSVPQHIQAMEIITEFEEISPAEWLDGREISRNQAIELAREVVEQFSMSMILKRF